jgi:hypothetical protein
MRIAETKVFTIEELDPKAKAKALDWLRQSNDYPWHEENLAAVKAFCARFGIEVKNYEMGGYTPNWFDTNASPAHFRGYTLKDAKAILGTYPTGLYLDDVMNEAFVKQFEETGNAYESFFYAVHQAAMTIRQDIENCDEDEYLIELALANEYEFTENGRFF